MRKYLMEFIGTFFLMLTVSLVVLSNPGMGGPFAIGAVLMVMVYAGGAISGGHYNPAVSLAAWIRGVLPVRELAPYIGAQALGAFLAAYLAPSTLTTHTAVSAAHPAIVPTMLAEFLFTFALVFVVLNVATTKASSGNSYFGLAIGFTVAAGAVAVGPISGGVFNPAVALGLTALGSTPLHEFPLFILSQLLAGTTAAFAFRYLQPNQ